MTCKRCGRELPDRDFEWGGRTYRTCWKCRCRAIATATDCNFRTRATEAVKCVTEEGENHAES